ncbi:MAG: nitrogen fixation protein NifH [Chloroflexota bacterium]
MPWQDQQREKTLTWLLEPDNPGVRYLAMRDILKLPGNDADLIASQELAHREGPLAVILEAMNEAGYWVEAGPGHYPKYRGSVWSLITLAQLGASPALDKRVRQACDYLLEHALTVNGQFTVSGAPSGTADCLQGNLCDAMIDLGINDTRLETAFEWMARSVTGEGVAPLEDKQAQLRYYAGNCGPVFACGSNNKYPCAWGGVKVMLAFSKLPPERRTPIIQRAIQQGVDFLFSVDPATASYPTGWSDKPSKN